MDIAIASCDERTDSSIPPACPCAGRSSPAARRDRGTLHCNKKNWGNPALTTSNHIVAPLSTVDYTVRSNDGTPLTARQAEPCIMINRGNPALTTLYHIIAPLTTVDFTVCSNDGTLLLPRGTRKGGAVHEITIRVVGCSFTLSSTALRKREEYTASAAMAPSSAFFCR